MAKRKRWVMHRIVNGQHVRLPEGTPEHDVWTAEMDHLFRPPEENAAGPKITADSDDDLSDT